MDLPTRFYQVANTEGIHIADMELGVPYNISYAGRVGSSVLLVIAKNETEVI